MKYALVLAIPLLLCGCAQLVPWVGVISSAIYLMGTTENDATQIIIERDMHPQVQPTTKPVP